MRIKLEWWCGLLLAALTSAAQGDFATGVAAYESGDYETAYQEFKALADQGVAEAQYNLALMYDHGTGVKQDPREAARWYRAAAEQGDSGAQYNLGLMYAEGQGLEPDYAQALKWYRLAAEQGDASAQLNLGALYANGQGVERDYVTAYAWFNVASTQGSDMARENRRQAAALLTGDELERARALSRDYFDQYVLGVD